MVSYDFTYINSSVVISESFMTSSGVSFTRKEGFSLLGGPLYAERLRLCVRLTRGGRPILVRVVLGLQSKGILIDLYMSSSFWRSLF